MFGRRNAQARQQTEADRLFAEADRLDEVAGLHDYDGSSAFDRPFPEAAVSS